MRTVKLLLLNKHVTLVCIRIIWGTFVKLQTFHTSPKTYCI